MDVTILTGGLTISLGFENNFFVLYYAALAMFAAVCMSLRATFAGVTVVAAMYVGLSLTAWPGGDIEIKEDEVLLMRIIAMYAVVAAVNLVSRFEGIRAGFERARRREAVERERGLQRERIELSQTIHDTIAQSSYMIGLGLETAIELADAQKDEKPRGTYRQAGGYPCAVEIDHVGVKASHRHRSHFRGAGAESGITVARLDVHHNHVDPHKTGPIGYGAAPSHIHPATSILDSSQRHDERASALARRQNNYSDELPG